jgi:hypothetical protein
VVNVVVASMRVAAEEGEYDIQLFMEDLNLSVSRPKRTNAVDRKQTTFSITYVVGRC